MRPTNRWRTAVVAGILVAAGLTGYAPAQAKPAAATKTITLITGDKVTVLPGGRLRAEPAKGREQVHFIGRTSGNRTSVIPTDAQRLIAAGKLDPRFFDITGLLAGGYDDAHRADVPVILQYGQAAKPRLAGVKASRDLPSLRMSSVRAGKNTDFWNSITAGDLKTRSAAPAISRIWLDGKRKINLDQSVPQIGAPTAWAAGHTGKGVTVAVLDTGVDATHPDLAGKIAENQDFTGGGNTDDTIGHGTHVASTITGSGAASAGKYKGVAPDVKIASGKVCGTEYCDDSAILAGMTWAAQTVHAKVVNISLGGDDTPGLDPLEQAVNDLSASTGTLFVVAAGNHPPGSEFVSSPGSADAALTVGAVSKQDQYVSFSNHGPRIDDQALKPDIAAPGLSIVAAKAAHGVIGEPVENPAYVNMSGTSMATPHVVGSAAILAGEHPAWTGQQIKAALMASAKQLDKGTVFQIGAGRVDVGKAVSQNVTANPASLSLPTQTWPHTDDQPVTRTITYHNDGTAPVTLSSTVDVRGPDGAAVPAGMFKLSADSVTVPAGGDASLTLTVDTRIDGPLGELTGRVLATGGSQSVSTPLAILREAELYNLTIENIGIDGKPLDYAYMAVVNYATGPAYATGPFDPPNGTITLRLPKGKYALHSDYASDEPFNVHILSTPMINLDMDTKVVADYRTTKPLDMTVDDPQAGCGWGTFNEHFTTGAGRVTIGSYPFGDASYLSTGTIGAGSSLFRTMATNELASGTSSNCDGINTLYHLAQPTDGKAPTGVTMHAQRSQLAKVRNRHVPLGADNSSYRGAVAYFADGPTGMLPAGRGFGDTVAFGVQSPATIDDYVTPDTVRWGFGISSAGSSPGGSDVQSSQPRVFQRNKDYQNLFNVGVFGPAFRPEPDGTSGVTQYPGEMYVRPALFSDGSLDHSGHHYNTTSGQLTLYRDGKKVAEDLNGYPLDYVAPSTNATYRLDAAQSQSVGATSTQINASWTFRSTRTDRPDGIPLPLFALRFTPKVDDSTSAPAGRTITVPITADRQDGTANALVLPPKVEFSTDDGKTWKRVTVVPTGFNKWATVITNPANGFVSLRASARDIAGNTCDQTIIRAYAVH